MKACNQARTPDVYDRWTLNTSCNSDYSDYSDCSVSACEQSTDNIVPISLLSLNVCGLISKFKYDVFVEKLSQNKIVCLSEIKADSVDCITIQNFASEHDFVPFCKPRKKALRKSGGLCTLISNDIVKYVKEVHTDLETIQWFCFDKELFGMDKDLLLGNVYLPPPNSPYAGEDMFADIERSLLDHRYTNYNLIIVGDFNAHTSTKQDYIDLSDETAENLGVRNCTDLFELYNCKVNRSNQDKTKCDLYGSNLLQLCKTAGICIFNGRVTGDEEGSHTTSKCTTIDYVVGSQVYYHL